MNVVDLDQQVISLSSFDSSSMNPSGDYSSNPSSTLSPRTSRFGNDPISFPFDTMDTADPGKRSPVRRPSKMNLLSLLFSGSRRDLKPSKKSSRDLSVGKSSSSQQSTMKTASSTTLDLSLDAAQVFSTLQSKQVVKPQRGVVRQKSEDTMIGSVLEIPASLAGVETDQQQHDPLSMKPSSPLPQRPKLPMKAASVRNFQQQSNDFVRVPSTRSVSFQSEHLPRTSSTTTTTTTTPTESQVPPCTNTDSSACSVEISPGNFQALRGHKETLKYVRDDKVADTTCLFCNDTIYAINDAAMVVCPTCRSITPLLASGDGLALGFTAHEWLEIQREALAIQ